MIEGRAWFETEGKARALRIERRASMPVRGRCNFFAPDFALISREPWLVGSPQEPTFTRRALPALKNRTLPDPLAFAKMHAGILQQIHAGELSKVVPLVCEELDFATELEAEMFIPAHVPSDQYSYGFSYQGEGLCGVTPELLFSFRDGVLSTMALAGTGPSDGPSLLDDRKERLEHQIVIDHIVAELQGLGHTEVGDTRDRNFASLKHLYTPIVVRMNRMPEFQELVRRLHPTAALGGWPRSAALRWLRAQDFHIQRRRFGAPFGWVAGDEMMCVVAIRGLQWEGARALLCTGCGVVKGSQADREWNELRLKREATANLLGLP